MVKDIRIADFDYNLPDDMIPRHPLMQRDACRLLVSAPDRSISHRKFYDLPGLLSPGTLLVCNDTRVINARIAFRKPTGSRIEIFLLEPADPSDYVLTFQTRGRCSWSCLVGNLKKWKEGQLSVVIRPEGALRDVTLTATRVDSAPGNAHIIEFTWDDPDVTFASVVEAAGFIPIPPYLKRESEPGDASDYQTVYAHVKGSVAAPTAGLHFTPEVFDRLAERGVEVGKLTLHVGAGTFQPVKADRIGEHPMHTETFSISRSLLSRLISQKKNGSPIAAVGTTTVRTLESLPLIGAAILSGDTSLHVDQWTAYSPDAGEIDTIRALEAIATYMDESGADSLTASTAIMIAPGFRWRMVDVMVTNFHQPQSTLLLLVSSFLGEDKGEPRWRGLYDEALREGYRFLSYGDACLLFPGSRLRDITLPPSKSIGARYLVASYFAGTLPGCRRFDDCDDLRVIQSVLLNLCQCEGTLLDVHASGTAFRFVTAVAASTPGAEVTVTGTPRLCSRPMAPLVETLADAGAVVTGEGPGATGPYKISGKQIGGGDLSIRGDVSSQFISALMLVSPTWEKGMRLRFTTPLVSRPYAEMTAGMMRRFGINVTLTDAGVEVLPGKYVVPGDYVVEADWSAAGFFYEAALISPLAIRIAHLVAPGDSLQGDSATAAIFARLGVRSVFDKAGAVIERTGAVPPEIDVDMTDTPDLAPALAVGCALAGVKFRFSGVRNLRLKECDRLEAISTELRKLGYVLTEGDDTLVWDGNRCQASLEPIATYDDHRIAMAFGVARLVLPGLEIENPQVVDKSFGDFWRQLSRLFS